MVNPASHTRFLTHPGAARANLRYIQRHGVTPEGEPGQLYGPDTDQANGTTFLDDCGDDRHQFRLIVSLEDGAQLHDLKPFIRDFIAQVERDLETKLDWVAVDHPSTATQCSEVVWQCNPFSSSRLLA